MKTLFAVLFLATQIHRADAITWEFDTADDAQGLDRSRKLLHESPYEHASPPALRSERWGLAH